VPRFPRSFACFLADVFQAPLALNLLFDSPPHTYTEIPILWQQKAQALSTKESMALDALLQNKEILIRNFTITALPKQCEGDLFVEASFSDEEVRAIVQQYEVYQAYSLAAKFCTPASV